jgi:hypothetical protein
VSSRPAAEVLRQVLSTAGVRAAYGKPFPGLAVTEVADPHVALLLSHAHRAVHGVPAVAHIGGGRIVAVGLRPTLATDGPNGDRSSELSLPERRRVIREPDELRTLAPALAEALTGDGLRVELDVEPSSRVRDGAVALPPGDDEWAEPEPSLLAELSAAHHVLVLAGPGVINRRAVGGLRALAAVGRLGVLNTWGASACSSSTSTWAGCRTRTLCWPWGWTRLRLRGDYGRSFLIARLRRNFWGRWRSAGEIGAHSQNCRLCARGWLPSRRPDGPLRGRL